MIEHFLEKILPYIIGSLEFIGAAIISIAAIRSVFNLLKNKFNFSDDKVAIKFIKAMSLSLEFKLAAEIIKTGIIKTLDEFYILAAVSILRVVISVVLHWELKSGVKSMKDNGVDIE